MHLGAVTPLHRHHFGKEYLSEHLTLMDTRKLPNKLPDALLKQRQEQRARDWQLTALSIQAFADQLITVVVFNDLGLSQSPISLDFGADFSWTSSWVSAQRDIN
ncbi:hypothetical protein B0H14DRAFT_2591167 [Mycena olivaceomarginata]|nr:hypothetical protein B0H14DRAFT_2591167 [Mycena olivaceomarginata]